MIRLFIDSTELLWNFSILTKFVSPNCSFHNMILYDILFIFSKIFYKWPLVVVEWSVLIKPRYYVITLFNRFWIRKTFLCVVSEYFFNKLVFFLFPGMFLGQFRLIFSSICRIRNNMARGKMLQVWLRILFSPSAPRNFELGPTSGPWSSNVSQSSFTDLLSFLRQISIWLNTTGNFFASLLSNLCRYVNTKA